MLKYIMDSINNHFINSYNIGKIKEKSTSPSPYIYLGTSSIERSSFLVGQYILVRNSILNDGVYKILSVSDTSIELDTDLCYEKDEFCVYGLRIPKDFILLVNEMEQWQNNHSKTNGIASEKTGEYTISFDTNKNNVLTAFSSRLHVYRKVFSDLQPFTKSR